MASTRIVRTVFYLSASVLLCAATAVAQTEPSAPGSPQSGNTGENSRMNSSTGGSASAADKTFVRKAMEGNMAEIQLGQLAQQKTSNSDVKQFGQRMVSDHTRLEDQIKPIAQQLGVTPPTELSAKDKELSTKLEGLSGDAFDKAYIDAMVDDHRKDDQEFKKEERSAKNPAVKKAAKQAEPIIAEHLRIAEGIQNGAKPTGIP